MSALIQAIVGLPLRLATSVASRPVGFVLVLIGVQRRRSYRLPVAGLSAEKAQPIYFALRRAAATAEDQAVADRWLGAVTTCQCGFGLLLSELDEVEANLRFWYRREQRGGHFWHSLLRRGPAQFVRRLAVLLHVARREEGALEEADLVEKRVLIFRLLRSAVTDALAQVQAAAALLYLKEPTPGAAGEGGGAGGSSAAMAGEALAAGERLFWRADAAAAAAAAAVAAAFQGLERAAAATLAGQAGPAAAPAQDWQVLQGALSRVLGMHHVRRVLSRLQLVHAQQAEQVEQAQQAGAPQPAQPPPGGGQGAAGGGGGGGAAHAVVGAQRAMGVELALGPNLSVHSALEQAQRAVRGARGRRLIQVPRWALMPSEAQQHWIRYAAICVAAGYGSLFVYRHSRLSGSRDLEEWAARGLGAVRGAWREHVVTPLAGLKDELFNTFRRRPTVVSAEDFEVERDSLQRMLDDFQRDFVRKRGGTPPAARAPAAPPAAADAAGAAEGAVEVLEGMDLVMRTYEREMQRPLRNLVGGELVRALLIQVQKLKVDTASAMLEMDQILKANELSISLVAAIPSFAIAGGCLFYLGRLITPTPPDPRREALPVRMSMVGVERALEQLAAAQEAEQRSDGAEEAAAEARERLGLYAYRLAVAYEEARELFRRHRGLLAIGGSEWPSIRSDLLELASPGPATQHARTAQRMLRSYSVFNMWSS